MFEWIEIGFLKLTQQAGGYCGEEREGRGLEEASEAAIQADGEGGRKLSAGGKSLSPAGPIFALKYAPSTEKVKRR